MKDHDIKTTSIELHFRCDGHGATLTPEQMVQIGTPLCGNESCDNFDEELEYYGWKKA